MRLKSGSAWLCISLSKDQHHTIVRQFVFSDISAAHCVVTTVSLLHESSEKKINHSQASRLGGFKPTPPRGDVVVKVQRGRGQITRSLTRGMNHK